MQVFQWASDAYKLDVMNDIVQKVADNEEYDIDRAFMQCVGRGRVAVVSCLGAAVGLGRFDVARLLLEHGADINQVDSIGNTILHYTTRAVHSAADKAIEFLVEEGADTGIKNDMGETPLFEIARNTPRMVYVWDGRARAQVAANAGVLLRAGVNTEERDNSGHTVLHKLMTTGPIPLRVVMRLLSAGADPGNVGDDGHTAMYYAVRANSTRLVEMLIQRCGVSVEGMVLPGYTPMQLASKSGRIHVMEMLLDLGADINKPNDIGNTPLHHALRNVLLSKAFRYKTVRCLLKRGANLFKKNDLGLTALELYITVKPVLNHHLLYSKPLERLLHSVDRGVRRVIQTMNEETLADRQLAVMMGLEQRLGGDSRMRSLDPDLVSQMVQTGHSIHDPIDPENMPVEELADLIRTYTLTMTRSLHTQP